MTSVEVVPQGAVDGALAAPPSKSVTNRLLVMAALAEGDSLLRGPLVSDDTEAMRDAVTALGAVVDETAEGWLVHGTGGHISAAARPVDARLSGTTMRFGMALAALSADTVELTGRPGLLARPVGPLTAALAALGAQAEDHDGFPPVRVGGGLVGGPVRVRADQSSQFASALLLAAPYAREPVRLQMLGASAYGYVELTVAKMLEWGAQVSTGEHVEVQPSRYEARAETMEHDASAAAHLFALAVATGGSVTVTNAAAGTAQPDARLPDVLVRMGAKVERDGDALVVHGPGEPTPVDVDLAAMPDQVITIATLAALAPGRSTITGVAVTRGHETDRLAAVTTELGKLGVLVEESPSGLVVHGGTASGPAEIDPHGDHRMAMAFAALAARVPGVRIADPDCVAKTYPRFWEDAAALGVRLG